MKAEHLPARGFMLFTPVGCRGGKSSATEAAPYSHFARVSAARLG